MIVIILICDVFYMYAHICGHQLFRPVRTHQSSSEEGGTDQSTRDETGISAVLLNTVSCNSSCNKINVLKQATRIYNQSAAEVQRESAATSISTQLMEGIGGTSGGSVCR